MGNIGGGGMGPAVHDARDHAPVVGVLDVAEHLTTDHEAALGLPGAWTSYVPAWTTTGVAPAIGNGTLSGKYMTIPTVGGRLVLVSITFKAGTTTTFGTGNWSFSLPIAPTGGRHLLTGLILDNGTDRKLAVSLVGGGAATFAIAPEGGSDVHATSPMTWANLDELDLAGWYEAAA